MIEDNTFESGFDKWKNIDVARIKAIEEAAANRAKYLSDETATAELHKLTKRSQGVTREPLLTDEEEALRRALLKRFNIAE